MSRETIVYQIELTDGRIFRVFCANSSQKKKMIESYYKLKNVVKEITTITVGLHTQPQFEKILPSLV